MRLPKKPTAFDVARKVICDAFDLVAAGDIATLDRLLCTADQAVGCGHDLRRPNAWKKPAVSMFFSAESQRWWLRYLKAKDVRDCLVQADIKRNQEECARRNKQGNTKRRAKK